MDLQLDDLEGGGGGEREVERLPRERRAEEGDGVNEQDGEPQREDIVEGEGRGDDPPPQKKTEDL